ncbi:MAG: DNA cytosine methyltransferase [Thermoprotei archaeon]|nr:DNA cytosine methyltransferase [Thermoprotei archaeon]
MGSTVVVNTGKVSHLAQISGFLYSIDKIQHMKFFDLFCGTGGLSYGLYRAGFSTIGGLDKFDPAADTYEARFGVHVLKKDAFSFSPSDLVKVVDSFDVLVGGPPCQGFSTLKIYRYGPDARNDLVLYYARVVELSKPKAIIFENVPLVVKDARFEYLKKVLYENDYSLDYHILNAADYGVPQRRLRLILIAVRGARKVELPEPDYGSPDSPAVRKGVREPWRTVRDVISDLPPIDDGECHQSDPLHCAKKLNPRYKEIMRHVPKNGGSRDSVPLDLLLPTHRKHPTSFRDSFGRLRWDEPSVTITTKFYDPSSGRFTHPEQDRALSLREGARLQSFPDDYPFKGTFTQIARQIGEAFPPLLAEKVGRRLKEYL